MLSSTELLLLCYRALLLAAAATTISAQQSNATDTPCLTGPPLQETNAIFANGRQYLGSTAEVQCDGVIISWHFCHHVIGFRHLEMALWAGAWRREEDEYNLVGLNVILVEPPGYGENRLCVDYDVDPADWIETREGDYIGFFLPDNGVFIATTSAPSDPGALQMRRIEHGYAESFNASDLGSVSGRALISAQIDSVAVKPTVFPTPATHPTKTTITTPTISQTPEVMRDREGESTGQSTSPSVAVLVVVAVSLGIIVALLVVITVLVVMLRRQRQAQTGLHPLQCPLSRTVDATNPANVDDGSGLYEAIYSQAYIRARESGDSAVASEIGYDMISNPAYLKGNTLTLANSPPITNPAHAAMLQPVSSSILLRYPPMLPRSRRNGTYPIPTSHMPFSPPPVFPAPPPPPLARSRNSQQQPRPPPLNLKSPPPKTPTTFPPHPLSPPSPYSNPYKTPRPRSPDKPVTILSQNLPQVLSTASTLTHGSDETLTSRSSGCTESTSTTE